MASKMDREGAKFTRDNIDAKATALGHNMTWKLGPLATRKGQAYFFDGDCEHCAAHASAGSMWSSSHSIIDARRDQCTGPGTYVLTEIEAARASELIAPAIAEFAAAVRRQTARLN
jgi:hypothetical protein